jgi:signal transduction histidine kinase
VTISVDRVQAAVVVSELLRNSLQAIEDGGTVRVQVQKEEEAALLMVADNGRGLSAADREHLFDPFYSGRPAGRGLGFGLSKCWRIVTQHGGQIEAADEDGGGVRVTVKWPPGTGW